MMMIWGLNGIGFDYFYVARVRGINLEGLGVIDLDGEGGIYY